MKDAQGPLETFLRIRSYEVSATGCHVWKRIRDLNGYGKVYYKGKGYLAHRLSWQFVNGPIPPGLYVMHKCDNPPCINPEHLMLGTAADNSRDMVSKGRSSHGFGARKRTQDMSVTEQYALEGRTYTGDAAHRMRVRQYQRERRLQRYYSDPEIRAKNVDYVRRWRAENRERDRAWYRARAQRQLEADPQAQARRYARLQQQRERALKREQHQQLMASTFGIQEIADLAGVDRTTVFRWFTSGKLHSVVDGHWRATADVVFPFLAERQKRKGWNKRNIA